MYARTISRLLLAGLLVLLAASPQAPRAAAQGGDTPVAGDTASLSIDATVESRISYQGVLKEGGLPVSGDRDMVFRFYFDSACSAVEMEVPLAGVSVKEGLFAVTLDVKPALFNGRGVWLSVFVDGSGLGCQELLPVPYALSLRPGAEVVGDDPNTSLYVENIAATGDGLRGIANNGWAGVYGRSTANYGVWGEGRYGVFGLASPTNGVGVRGRASSASGLTYGVNGVSESAGGYGGFFENTAGGADIKAGGSGIITSVATTSLSINPFAMEATSELADNQYLSFQHHWLGYAVITNTSGSGSRTAYIPVHNLTRLFGAPLKLQSLEVCYQVAGSSYIDQTRVFYANGTGGRTELVTNGDNRSSTTWGCYSISPAAPVAIEGPLLVYFNLWLGGTGTAHAITIGRVTATLVE